MSEPDKDNKPRSGHVRHDPGGRAIWEWAMESGRHAVDSTSRLLKKLELTSLTLMGDDAKPWQKQVPGDASDADQPPLPDTPPKLEAEVDPAARRGGGFNPYDSRTPMRPVAKAPPRAPAQGTQAAHSKRGFFARLFGRK